MRRIGTPTILLAAVVFTGVAFQSAAGQRLRFEELHRMIPPDLDQTYSIAFGDVDGDGDLDAFLGNAHATSGESNRLYLNEGNGRFIDASSRIPSHVDSTNCVALGDVDGDGDLDAFLANGGYTHGDPNRLYLNDGSGVFTDASSQIPDFNEDTYCVALGDVDGDGDLDAVIGNLGIYREYQGWIPEPNRLFLNDGTGVFSDATSQVPYDRSLTTSVALGDVDGDGDLDAFIGNDSDPNELALNDGTGVFTSATPQIPHDSDNTNSVMLVDVDGDGDLDAFIGNGSPRKRNRLYLNDGGGVFTDATAQIPAHREVTFAIALDDVDGDGDIDALIGNGGEDELNRLYLNDGIGNFSDATSQIPAASFATTAVALGDLDGDGDCDALIGEAGYGHLGPQNRLYLNNGMGDFSDTTSRAPNFIDLNPAVALGDVDGDGDLDLLMGINTHYTSYDARNRLFLNDGAGCLSDASSQIPPHNDSTHAVALGDVDGDGDLDALIANMYSDPNHLYLNDGNGVFFDASSQIPDYAEYTLDVAFGDVDGDGDLDVVIVNNYDPNRLFLNDGAGVFSDATSQIPADNDYTYCVTLGDVDGDGDLDLLIGNFRDSMNHPVPNRLYLNDGTGLFSDASSQIPSVAGRTAEIALGDVDADGDLDALIGNGIAIMYGYPESNRLYLNDGGGVFSDASAQIPGDAAITSAAMLGDVDLDGDLDIVFGNEGSRNFLYLNDGAGVFTDAVDAMPLLANSTRGLALGDLDGDGDADLVEGNGYMEQCLFYSNLTRQIAWRAVPRIGKPLVIDVFGPPAVRYLLAGSRSTVSIPAPPYGTLRIGPGTIFYQFGANLDQHGRASVEVGVPAYPWLVGTSVYWQAVIFEPKVGLRLTNLEVTTVTDL